MKLSLLALFTFLLFGFATAQTSIGVYGAFGQSNVRSGDAFDGATDQLDRIGTATFGVTAEIPVTAYFSLRPGLEYTSRGTAIGVSEGINLGGISLPVGARVKTRFDYVEAPLLIQLQIPTQSSIQPYVIAGPSLGYATSGRVAAAAKAVIELDLYSSSINLDAIRYDRFHVAAVGGVGANARLGEATRLFVEARYQHGLSQPYDVPVIQDKVGFQGWNVGAGVSFDLN
ncbi:outer membrane protein with beta-barrel domain [Neolewinella xylanilytica]|uniref:Outer membrane protein with beta-barrel domain n=1 Tax=Neolewinella xylanilytica TaxID=1514080 RepID=A0A2S6I3I9_9BACT|nr:porin family protein [Neolewinella xylanilytica]PPK85746.1 outer membrane protein with beta-barrel domain [Neolewinella xylanilytica]